MKRNRLQENLGAEQSRQHVQLLHKVCGRNKLGISKNRKMIRCNVGEMKKMDDTDEGRNIYRLDYIELYRS